MRGFFLVVLCTIGVCAASANAQSASIQPIHANAGAVLTFYSQTRLNPGMGNILDVLPKGTELKIRLLDSVDSAVDRDGLEFRGILVAPLSAGNEVIVHADAEVRGLLVLLRSGKHPEGFRYELLITSITENGKAYELTASLIPSFLDDGVQKPANAAPAAHGTDAKEPPASVAKTPERKN
jgi:hypothetical protein